MLLHEKVRSPREKQKVIRAKLRTIGFYISDFPISSKTFSPEIFDTLVRSGEITVEG